MQDILDADGDNPPAAMREQAYEFLGDADLPFARYNDPAFHELEMERLWPNVWQWACREEHIPAPGDRYVYDVGHHSVLVVRGADDRIRAFVNSCPHRGDEVRCGRLARGQARQYPLPVPRDELELGRHASRSPLPLGLSPHHRRQFRP
jgi:hypothetical protein